MSKLEMFENLPEGFRLATDDPIEMKLVALTIGQAFAEYPYPLPSTECAFEPRLKLWYAMGEGYVKNALEHGYILTNDDYSAVMLVTTFDHAYDFDTAIGAAILRENATEEDAENYLALVKNIKDAEEGMEWAKDTVYLDVLAVQPPRQGKKESSHLMRKLFEECDRLQRDVMLTTHTDRNASIYHHFGYETVEKLTDEENDSTCWYMLRRHDAKTGQLN